MVVPGEIIVVEESEETEDTDTADSIGDIDKSLTSNFSILSQLSPTHTRKLPLPSPAHTRSYGKAKKTKYREPFYKFSKGEGVVYLPGDINGLAKKLQLLAAEFFAVTPPEQDLITETQLNSTIGQITITSENQDQFLDLHSSYLLIEGDVLKADNTRYANADLIALTNNEKLHYFPV